MPVSPSQPTETHRCAECRQFYPRSELMEFSGFFVCAECKPITVSKLARGEPVGTIWRDGDRLVILRTANLPDRCVHCDEPAQGYRLKNTFVSYPPALLLLIVPCCAAPFLGVLSGNTVLSAVIAASAASVVIALSVRKSQLLEIPICPAHREFRKKNAVIGAVIAAFSIALLVIAKGRNDFLSHVGQAGLIFGIVWSVVRRRLPTCTRITKSHVILDGTAPAFRAGFPEWPRR